MNRRQMLVAALAVPATTLVRAHHGWSGFDQDRPLYVRGVARRVAWRNPHAEVDLDVDPNLRIPPDLAGRAVPPQSASVDAPKLLAAAQVPTRKDRTWHIELAPLTRMDAWKVPELKAGDAIEVLGFAAPGEKGDPVLRAEYLFVGGKAYGLRSSPA